MARILVTGGLGFIGSNLVPEPRRQGHEVWVCDLYHSHEPNYMRCDVKEYRQFQRAIEKVNPEYVYHLAAEYGRWNGEGYVALGERQIIKSDSLTRRPKLRG